MTDPEARWRAERMQHLLAVDELDRFTALAQVRQEARSAPWTAIESIASIAYTSSASGEFKG